MKNSNTVLIDKNPGRNSQTYGIARELGTDLGLIHEPSVGVVGNKGDSQCYIGVAQKVGIIHDALKDRVGHPNSLVRGSLLFVNHIPLPNAEKPR